jgi:endonuclease/exonuclease/phosphatase family metal-dependent hydrolase
VVDTHCEYRSGVEYDKIREAQCKSMIKQAVAKAAGIPIIFGGDFNSSVDQTYDGAGIAFTAAGYVDAEFVAGLVTNSEYSTTNGLLAVPRKNTRHIDRFFVKKGTIVKEWTMDINLVNGLNKLPLASDHNGVVISVVL